MILWKSSVKVQSMIFLKAAKFKARSGHCSSLDSYILTAYNASVHFSLACHKEHRRQEKQIFCCSYVSAVRELMLKTHNFCGRFRTTFRIIRV